jgi:hypothetical protein
VSTKRLFVSISLPHSITQRLAELDPHLRGVRWLAPEQMHLTLSFLGNVATDVEEALKKNLNAIAWKAFFLPISGSTFRQRAPEHYLGRCRHRSSASFSNCTNASGRRHPRGSRADLVRFIHTSPRVAGMCPNQSDPFFERAAFDAGMIHVESFCLNSSSDTRWIGL